MKACKNLTKSNDDDHHLPDEILIEIFTRLPAKSVGKCRCVSKSWRAHLSTPQFINQHLIATLKTNQRHNLIFLSFLPNGRDRVYTITPITQNVVATELDLPNTAAEIIGSCNGLVLLTIVDESDCIPDIFLINPTTLHKLKLPRYHLKSHGFEVSYGFGYDSFTDDYKIVQLSYFLMPSIVNSNVLVDVYSVKSGVWKRIESSPNDQSFRFNSSGAFVNGAIHWMSNFRGSRCPSVIAAFDLTSELFSEIPAPANKYYDNICVLGGCLCIVYSYCGGIGVWIMKEYGNVGSWTKMSLDARGGWNIEKPFCFIGDKEFVELTNHGKMFMYDILKKTCRGMVVNGVTGCLCYGTAYIDSLVWPVKFEAEQRSYGGRSKARRRRRKQRY